ESITVGFTGNKSGTYASSNAGQWTVTASNVLGASDVSVAAGTSLSNYILPTSYSGLGTIKPASLSYDLNTSITGNPTKVYDGNTDITLASSNFNITGWASGEGGHITGPINGQF